MTMATEQRYLRPGVFTQHVFNRLVRRLTRWGLSVWGSRELRVVGRRSGTVRDGTSRRTDCLKRRRFTWWWAMKFTFRC